MFDQLILIEARKGFRVITLGRPDRLNAFNEAMQVALRAALGKGN
jgi:2-(1,2-epoxy-1,2-dihydrophenyl)acetyl-CoA isomerase